MTTSRADPVVVAVAEVAAEIEVPESQDKVAAEVAEVERWPSLMTTSPLCDQAGPA